MLEKDNVYNTLQYDEILNAIKRQAKLSDVQPVEVTNTSVSEGGATADNQALILEELALKANLTDTQPVTIPGLLIDEGSFVTRSYLQAVAEGDIANHTLFEKVSYHPASTAAETTVWVLGTQYVFPAAEIAVEIISSSVNDVAATGTGARTVVMGYLDDTYTLKKHTFNLNGTTAVAGPTDLFRLNMLYVATAGSGGKTAGNISVRLVGGAATVYGYIAIGHTTNRSSVFTVPLGYTVYIQDVIFTSAYSSAGKTERITLHTSVNPEGVVNTDGLLFYNKFEAMVVDGNVVKNGGAPIKCPEKTDVKISVIGETNAQIICTITGWMETI